MGSLTLALPSPPTCPVMFQFPGAHLYHPLAKTLGFDYHTLPYSPMAVLTCTAKQGVHFWRVNCLIVHLWSSPISLPLNTFESSHCCSKHFIQIGQLHSETGKRVLTSSDPELWLTNWVSVNNSAAAPFPLHHKWSPLHFISFDVHEDFKNVSTYTTKKESCHLESHFLLAHFVLFNSHSLSFSFS